MDLVLPLPGVLEKDHNLNALLFNIGYLLLISKRRRTKSSILNNINFSKKFLGLAATLIALTLISGVFVVFHLSYPATFNYLVEHHQY